MAPNRPHLSLAEAKDAAQTFLTEIGLAPTRVDEPVDGVIELEGAEYIARVKYDRDEVGQGALIALMKAAGDEPGVCMLFSATGFSSSAREMAESHAYALFEVDLDAQVLACSTSARVLMPHPPPRADHAELTHASTNPFARGPDDEVIEDHEWLECPNCRTTHHPEANFCATCGGSVVARGELGPTQATGKAVGDRALATNPGGGGTPVPKPTDGSPQLKCRTCGSHDIELVGS